MQTKTAKMVRVRKRRYVSQTFSNLTTDKQVAEQDDSEKDLWKFKELGKQLREAKYLVCV